MSLTNGWGKPERGGTHEREYVRNRKIDFRA